MNQYSDFAFIYDELMNDVDYNKWVEYIEDIIKSKNVNVKNNTFILLSFVYYLNISFIIPFFISAIL